MSVSGSSSSSGSSSWSRTSKDSDGSVTRYRDRRLPNTWAVNALIYATGRRPRSVRKVRVYETTWPDQEEDDYSYAFQKKTEIVFIESKRDYDWDSYSDRQTVSGGSSGRVSRSSRRGDPWKGGGRRAAYVDDESEDGSIVEEPTFQPPPRGPPPPNGMPFRHPMGGGAPPGAFQPVYGRPVPAPGGPGGAPGGAPGGHFVPGPPGGFRPGAGAPPPRPPGFRPV